MKKSIILLLMAAVAFSSCEKFLDSKPVDFLDPDSYYTNRANLDAGLMGVYTVLSSTGSNSGTGSGYSIYGGENMPYRLTISDLEYYAGYPTVNTALAIFDFTSADGSVDYYWRALYNGILRANAFIEAVEPAQLYEVGDQYKTAALGEAYALRGFYYWHLAANFGGVPLRTTYDIYPHKKRATLRETYEQVLRDLKKAEGMVYQTGAFNHTGRITQNTVQALLARVYLYMAGEPLKDRSLYGEAAEWARKVKESGMHTLNPSYENLFTRMIRNQYDLDYRESMWEAEFELPDGEMATSGGWGNVNGILCRDESIGYASPQILVSRLLENWYMEEPGDKRYDWSVAKYTWGKESTGVKSNQNLEVRYCGKYRKDVFSGPKDKNLTGTNFPIMRYADVLLMLAEAVNEMDGPTDEAIDALNEVRRRAGVKECANHADDPHLVALTTKEEFREFIKRERALELCFEATRRLDLIRWGHLAESVKYMSSVATSEYAWRASAYISSPKHNLLPIPASEMNNNNLAEQNPGW